MTVWLWEDLKSWERPLWTLLRDILGPTVVRQFKAAPPEYVVGDDLSWLDDIIYDVRGERVDIKSLLTERLCSQFDAIRAYHGTRTADVGSFYTQGLKTLNADEFEARARKIFLTDEFPELTEASLAKAITLVGRDLRHGSLFFDAHRRELLELCSHYMLYGSEYLTAIAANLGTRHDYRQVLKRVGVPTIFECNVPLRFMHESAVAEFAGHALQVMFDRVLDKTYAHPEVGSGGGIAINCPLPPEQIVGHFHPGTLRDPFLGYVLVQVQATSEVME